MRRVWLLIAAVCAAAGSAAAQSPDAPAGERAAWAFTHNVVHITADDFGGNGLSEEGYGFIVGVAADGSALIVTADHVVRQEGNAAERITLQFMREQGRPAEAKLLGVRLAPEFGDLAVLEAPMPSHLHPAWPAMVPAYQLVLGDPAWRIGKGGRAVPPRQPGSFVGRHGPLLLEFDNLDTPSGSSGGPIIGEQGLIGMVVADGGLAGIPARVLPADTIGAMLRTWQIAWQILPPAGPQSAATAVAARPAAPPAPVTPAPVAPAPVAPAPIVPAAPPSRAVMEQMARDVAQRVLDALSAPAESGAASLDVSYGAAVLTDGKLVRHAVLVARERRCLDQWPRRRYMVRPGSMRADCNMAVAACRVEAAVAWARQGAGSAGESGQSRFTFSIAFAAAGPQVVAQTEDVVSAR